MRTAFISRTLRAVAATMILVSAGAARAGLVSFKSELSSSHAVPPNDSNATGGVSATYDPATRKFEYTITYAGLSGPATVAHFHGPAAPGANAGPELVIAGRPASPLKGEATLDDKQASDLEKGLWYLNIHTAAHPTGEIRGQLTRSDDPAASVAVPRYGRVQ